MNRRNNQSTYNDMLYAKQVFLWSEHNTQYHPKCEAMLPACEQLDIKLTVEMRHPHYPELMSGSSILN